METPKTQVFFDIDGAFQLYNRLDVFLRRNAMFQVHIDLAQKRYAEIPEIGKPARFITKTRVTKLDVTDSQGREGTIAIDRQLFLHTFPEDTVFEFEEGILTAGDGEPLSGVVPKNVKWDVGSGANKFAEVVAGPVPGVPFDFPEAFELACELEVTGTSPDFVRLIKYTFNGVEDSFDPNTLPDGVSLASGLWLVPTEVAKDAEEDISEETVAVKSGQELLWSGTWENDTIETVVIEDDGTTLSFKDTEGEEIFQPVAWADLTPGSSVALIDTRPEEPEVTGVLLSRAEGDTNGTPGTYEVKLEDRTDAMANILWQLVFRRVGDIVDLQGSVSRETELTNYFLAYRWVTDPGNVRRLYKAVTEEVEGETVLSLKPYTGTIDTADYVRMDWVWERFSDLAVADREAKAVVNLVRILKTQYQNMMNRSFSTDNDEYSTKEEIIEL